MRHVLRRNRLRLGLAALAAVATGLVLVAVLSDDEPSGSREDGGGRDGRHASQQASGDRRAATPAPGAKSPGGGGDEGEHEWSVYVVGRGGGRPRLTAPTPSEVPVTPAWSRRTDLIAFVRPGCEDCDAALWVTGPNGRGRRKLTGRVGNLTDPAWSPGGESLAAVRVGGGLYAISARDGGARPLLGRSVVEDPDWSPRGHAIAFARREGAANWDLFAIAPSGRRLRRLTRSRVQELAPDWSPDGARIAFQRQDRNGAWSVYVSRADGSRARRLIAGTSGHSVVQPAWSPDGRSIAYVGVTLESTRIEVARVGSGTAPKRITGIGLQAADPDWSPDGRSIVFSAKRAKN